MVGYLFCKTKEDYVTNLLCRIFLVHRSCRNMGKYPKNVNGLGEKLKLLWVIEIKVAGETEKRILAHFDP